MLKPVFAIYDEVAGEYGAPFVAQSDAVAYRDFASQIENARTLSNGLLATNYYDFNLVRVGYFDTETGLFRDSMVSDFFEFPKTAIQVVAIGGDFVGD